MALNVNNKLPHECSNIDEVRQEIDCIDNAIIGLLATRLKYVHEVVKYKDGTADGIVAADRRAAVLNNRRELAMQNGLNPDVIENIYKQLIEYFIAEEMNLLDK